MNWNKNKPILSLENAIRLIEKISNTLVAKSDYFLVKDVRLTSDETHKKLIKDSFKIYYFKNIRVFFAFF